MDGRCQDLSTVSFRATRFKTETLETCPGEKLPVIQTTIMNHFHHDF